MLHLSKTFVSLKQAVLRGVTILSEEKLPKVEPYIIREHLANAALHVDPTFKARPRPIYVDTPIDITALGSSGAYALFNATTGSLSSSSPASSHAPSLFSLDNSSTSTTLTVPSPLPIPTIVLSDYDSDDGDHIETGSSSDVEWEYKEFFLAKNENAKAYLDVEAYLASPPTVRSTKRYGLVSKKEKEQSVLWNCIDAPIPSPLGFSVVVPPSGRGVARTRGKSLKIGSGMFSFLPLCKWIAEETRRLHFDDIILVSKVYPGVIHDQYSYQTWCKWKEGRPAEDRMLWVLE